MMKSSSTTTVYKRIFLSVFLLLSASLYAQQTPLPKAKTDSFWERVDFGGGLGVGIGSGYTNITMAPSAIYNFNDYAALGTGVQYSYLKEKGYYSSNVFGTSLIGLFNPVEVVQLSLEIEETNVNNTYFDLGGDYKKSFWNTGLFLGAGFRQENLTIGGRINLLFDKDKDIYGSAFMPFVRAYF
jgi:hypothetical protein